MGQRREPRRRGATSPRPRRDDAVAHASTASRPTPPNDGEARRPALDRCRRAELRAHGGGRPRPRAARRATRRRVGGDLPRALRHLPRARRACELPEPREDLRRVEQRDRFAVARLVPVAPDRLEVQDVRYVEDSGGGTLYFNEACESYSSEAGGKCSALVALDPVARKVRWRTGPLVSNNAFVVTGNYIVAAYGFTAEPASIRVVRRKDGKVMDRHPLEHTNFEMTTRGETLSVEMYSTAGRANFRMSGFDGDAPKLIALPTTRPDPNDKPKPYDPPLFHTPRSGRRRHCRSDVLRSPFPDSRFRAARRRRSSGAGSRLQRADDAHGLRARLRRDHGRRLPRRHLDGGAQERDQVRLPDVLEADAVVRADRSPRVT